MNQNEKIRKLETAIIALEQQNLALATARDAEKARADAAEARCLELEVDALVGDRIARCERETFLELRKSNPPLFAKMISERAPMRLTESVVGAAGGARMPLNPTLAAKRAIEDLMRLEDGTRTK